ncbi:hypothetical protein LZ198_21690 [Myxococcus sp. K15C18031901]|nr:hypothetical protein [Myxococcus dinghuensis]MCP3101492.1 hypothetical protein [Myxococcus dinghuensis]
MHDDERIIRECLRAAVEETSSWSRYISVSPGDVEALFERWRATHGA